MQFFIANLIATRVHFQSSASTSKVFFLVLGLCKKMISGRAIGFLGQWGRAFFRDDYHMAQTVCVCFFLHNLQKPNQLDLDTNMLNIKPQCHPGERGRQHCPLFISILVNMIKYFFVKVNLAMGIQTECISQR